MTYTYKSLFSRLLFLLAMATSPISYGEQAEHKTMPHPQQHAKPTADSALEKLSPALRGLLGKEMRAIEQGMMAIIPAYASGNWDEIERIANKIKHSYILKQSLTQEQRHELHTSLPQGFIKQDEHFHYLSGMLAHAASMKKTELVGFYFSKMNEACASCHSQYATHTFPGFATKKDTPEHGH